MNTPSFSLIAAVVGRSEEAERTLRCPSGFPDHSLTGWWHGCWTRMSASLEAARGSCLCSMGFFLANGLIFSLPFLTGTGISGSDAGHVFSSSVPKSFGDRR